MPKDPMCLAEQFTALAVAEIVETHFPTVAPEKRAALMQSLRGPILAAVWSTLGQARRVKRRPASLKPSAN